MIILCAEPFPGPFIENMGCLIAVAMPSQEVNEFLREKQKVDIPPWMQTKAAAYRESKDSKSRVSSNVSLQTANSTREKIQMQANEQVLQPCTENAGEQARNTRFQSNRPARHVLDSSSKVFMFEQNVQQSVVWNAGRIGKNYKDKDIEDIHLLRDDLDIVSIAETDHSSQNEALPDD